MKIVQLISITPEDLNQPIFDYIDKKFDELKLYLQAQQQKKYLTRLEVCELLNVTLVTLHTWNKNGKLKAVGIGGRVLYLQEDIDNAIVKL